MTFSRREHVGQRIPPPVTLSRRKHVAAEETSTRDLESRARASQWEGRERRAGKHAALAGGAAHAGGSRKGGGCMRGGLHWRGEGDRVCGGGRAAVELAARGEVRAEEKTGKGPGSLIQCRILG